MSYTPRLPEDIGMLNGRLPALHAATADLIARGALREVNGGFVVERSRCSGLTELQRSIVTAIERGVYPLESDAGVTMALSALQKKLAEAGYLTRKQKPKVTVWLPALVMAAVALSVTMVLLTKTGSGMVMPILVIMVIGVVMTLRNLTRHKIGPVRRSHEGTQLLKDLRSRHQLPPAGQSPRPEVLGTTVALYGTRPLMMAVPAAAAFGWLLTDIPAPDEELQRMTASGTSGSSYSCSSSSSSTSDSDWDGDSNSSCCSCSGSSCSSGSSCGSSCSSGSSCGSSCSS